MHIIKIIGILLLLALVAVFTFQNTEPVKITFFLWSESLSVSLLLLAALFFGIVIGLFLSFLNTVRKSRREKNSGLSGASFPEPH